MLIGGLVSSEGVPKGEAHVGHEAHDFVHPQVGVQPDNAQQGAQGEDSQQGAPGGVGEVSLGDQANGAFRRSSMPVVTLRLSSGSIRHSHTIGGGGVDSQVKVTDAPVEFRA